LTTFRHGIETQVPQSGTSINQYPFTTRQVDHISTDQTRRAGKDSTCLYAFVHLLISGLRMRSWMLVADMERDVSASTGGQGQRHRTRSRVDAELWSPFFGIEAGVPSSTQPGSCQSANNANIPCSCPPPWDEFVERLHAQSLHPEESHAIRLQAQPRPSSAEEHISVCC
jgi:hypothetical protein